MASGKKKLPIGKKNFGSWKKNLPTGEKILGRGKKEIGISSQETAAHLGVLYIVYGFLMNTRPYFHFSPPSGWMNDPNGLVWHDGWWHLFYQHTPDSLFSGQKYWGHARSRDLILWEARPIALSPDELGQIFSGSAATLGDGRIVACFTHADFPDTGPREQIQVQSLAFSQDGGETFEKFAGNPVLTSERLDFRDPKIWRMGDGWKMIVAAGKSAQIFSSPDLIQWQLESEIPAPHDGWLWECPDLFSLDSKWVLLGSFIVSGQPHETHYWLGGFDGKTFSPQSGPHQLSFGPDDYAAVSWNDTPDDRIMVIGWMNSWAYVEKTPAEDSGFRGAMTLPRELSLREGALIQQPVRELEAYRGQPLRFDGGNLEVDAQAFEIELALDVELNGRAFFTLAKGGRTAATIGYDEEFSQEDEWQVVTLAREEPFDERREWRFFVGLSDHPRRVHLRVFVDACSVELFAQNGGAYGAALIFPDAGAWNLGWASQRATLVSGTVWPLLPDASLGRGA